MTMTQPLRQAFQHGDPFHRQRAQAQDIEDAIVIVALEQALQRQQGRQGQAQPGQAGGDARQHGLVGT